MRTIGIIILSLLPLLVLAQEPGRMLFGHNDALLYGRDWSDCEEGRAGRKPEECVSDVYQVCGAYPALFSTDLCAIEQEGRTIYWGGVTYGTMREAIIRHHRRGGAVTISWHMCQPDKVQTYFYKEECHGQVGRILQRKGTTYDNFMHILARGADFLLSLRDGDGNLIPVIFRPFHECNGSWAWWGAADCTPEQYAGLWRMTHEYMTSRGLTNLRYAFSPGTIYHGKAEYLQRFPGREYVDIIGVECYRPNEKDVEAARRLFHTRMQQNLRVASAIADSLHIPYAVTETGMQSDADPQWWTLGLMPALEGYSPMFLTCWSNQWRARVPEGGAWCTYPGEASARDFRRFYKRNKAGFIKVKHSKAGK